MATRKPAVPIPCIELFPKPTPIDPLSRFTVALQELANEHHRMGPEMVWIKREDLMAVGLGGNKLRNLEFHAGAALSAGASVLVTSGRGRANHCRLTAAAAARAGLPCVLVLTGPRPKQPSPNERIIELLGAEMRYAPDATVPGRDRLYLDTLNDLRVRGLAPYEVPLGASGVIGASGQVLAAWEVVEQLCAAGAGADFLFVGAATGGTYAGLRVGLAAASPATTVVGVPTYFSTASSAAEFREHLHSLIAELAGLWQTPPVDHEIVLDDLSDWLSYGEASPAATWAAGLLARTEGICIEPVYTARVAASIVAWTTAGRLDGKSIVLWDGGGTPALFEDYGLAPRKHSAPARAVARLSDGGHA